MSVLIAHPTGNEFFRKAAMGFYEANMLHSVYTGVACFPGNLFYRLGGVMAFSEIRRRKLDSQLKSSTHLYPWKELGRLASIKTGLSKLTAHETGLFSVDEVYKSVDNYVAKNLENEKKQGTSIVYAYEDGALNSFRKAKTLSVKCVYDLPIGYWRTMHGFLESEKKYNPEWAETIEGFNDSKEKLNRKDQEIALANIIIVASSFTRETLKNYPGKLPPVKVVPYGFPVVAAERKYECLNRKKKLKLLFAGGLSQRKGISYLFEAVKGLEQHVELTILGRTPAVICKPLIYALKKYKWIESLPHHKVLQLMQEQDLLIFPSLFEGFGQVITEAMAQGTPVIATDRTAGPDIIRNGENGWLVNAGSAVEIKNVIEGILLRPGIIASIGKQAMETARKRPWKRYQHELAETVKAL